MFKRLHTTFNYNGKTANIYCEITDKDGYISITGEIIPYGCRRPQVFGCIHEELAEAFPKLRPYLWLHLVNLDGSLMHEVANSLYMLANDDVKSAQDMLNCTDEEIADLHSLVRNGLHRTRTWWSYNDDKQKGWHISDKDSIAIYTKELEKFGLRARRRKAIAEFYSAYGETYVAPYGETYVAPESA